MSISSLLGIKDPIARNVVNKSGDWISSFFITLKDFFKENMKRKL
jgi:hypothetical protein